MAEAVGLAVPLATLATSSILIGNTLNTKLEGRWKRFWYYSIYMPQIYDKLMFKYIVKILDKMLEKNPNKYGSSINVKFDNDDKRYRIPIDAVYLKDLDNSEQVWIEPIVDRFQQIVVTFILRSYTWNKNTCNKIYKTIQRLLISYENELKLESIANYQKQQQQHAMNQNIINQQLNQKNQQLINQQLNQYQKKTTIPSSNIMIPQPLDTFEFPTIWDEPSVNSQNSSISDNEGMVYSVNSTSYQPGLLKERTKTKEK